MLAWCTLTRLEEPVKVVSGQGPWSQQNKSTIPRDHQDRHHHPHQRPPGSQVERMADTHRERDHCKYAR